MRKLLGDTAAIGVSHLIGSVAQIGLQIVIVRLTAPQMFGQYVAAIAYVSIAEALIVARGGELALQFVGNALMEGRFSAARHAAARVIRQDVLLHLGGWLLLVSVAVVLAPVYPLNIWYVVGLGLTIPVQIGYGVSKSMFIATGRLKAQALFEGTAVMAQAVFGVVGVTLAGIPGLVAAQVSATGFKTAAAWIWTRHWWSDADHAPTSADRATPTWSSFTALSMTRNAFSHAANHADVLILNATAGASAVAVYKVARTVAALPTRMAQPVWGALRPPIMESLAERRPERIRRLIMVPALGMLVALSVAVWPAWRWGGELIELLYGPGYRAAGEPFFFLLGGIWIFGVVTAWLAFWVVISEERRLGTVIFGLLLLLIVVLGVSYGTQSPTRMAMAVAVSMVVTSVAGWHLLIRSLRRLERVKKA